MDYNHIYPQAPSKLNVSGKTWNLLCDGLLACSKYVAGVPSTTKIATKPHSHYYIDNFLS